MKIIILDDVLMNVQVLAEAVSQFGSVDGFQDADRAMDQIRGAYLTGAPYDLLFLDITMPRHDGLDLLEAVVKMGKTYPGPKRTKVVMVTAHGEREQIVRAVQGGADGYILKPFQEDRVRAEITRLFPSSGRVQNLSW
jgi:two-component system, chemotaxis family, chemotaxis protein CheY